MIPWVKLLTDRITNYGGKYKLVASPENDAETIFAVGTAVRARTRERSVQLACWFEQLVEQCR